MTDKRSFLSADLILEQLENLYTLALTQDNISLAVRIKELQGRSLGLFSSSETPSISSLSDANVKKLIKQLEESLKV
jgi:hypothetical protein